MMGKRQRNRERVAGERPGPNEPKPWSRRTTRRKVRAEALDRAVLRAKSLHPSNQ